MNATQIDIFSDASIASPYSDYSALREAGPVVWLERQQLFAMPRYAEVVAALRDHATFSSAAGVGLVEANNARSIGTLIASDPPEHNVLRKAMMQPLSAGAVAELRLRLRAAADVLVNRLLDCVSFDAVTDFAQVLPISVVSQLVGLPEQGRENMLRWAGAVFDLFGPDNARGQAALPDVVEMRAYIEYVAHRGGVEPGGWADRLIDLAEEGCFPYERLASLFRDFMGPSLDTTINATSSMLMLLATHPDQWRALVADPALIRSTIDETVRLESPIRGFTRRLDSDIPIGPDVLPRGGRVLLLFGSANRDERKWDSPERFDITRRNRDHVGFGLGVHSCAGTHLARLEMESLLLALIERVERIEIEPPVWGLNNLLRGIERMPASFIAR